MNNVKRVSVVLAVMALLAGCEKSPEEMEKERQEAIIRGAMVKQVEDGKDFQEAINRPSTLNGESYNPANSGGLGDRNSDDKGNK